MADEKISELSELTAVAAGDLFAIVDDPGGTPATKKITFNNLVGSIPDDQDIAFDSGAKIERDDGDIKLTPESGKDVTIGEGTLSMGDSMPSTNVRCSVYLDSNITDLEDNVETLVTFDTETYDTGNDFDTTDNKFVAPVDGFYSIKTMIRILDVSGEIAKSSFIVKVNDSEVKGVQEQQFESTSSGDGSQRIIFPSINGDLELSANDEIKVYVRVIYESGATEDAYVQGNSIYSYLDIHLLST